MLFFGFFTHKSQENIIQLTSLQTAKSSPELTNSLLSVMSTKEQILAL